MKLFMGLALGLLLLTPQHASGMGLGFCKSLLKNMRHEAKKRKVKIPKGLNTTYSAMGSNRYYFIQCNNGVWLWEGQACCSFEARAKAIESLLDEKLLL